MNTSINPPFGPPGSAGGQHQLLTGGCHGSAQVTTFPFVPPMPPFNQLIKPQHDARMAGLYHEDQQLAETLNGLLSLTGYRLESAYITGSECAVVGGQAVMWRVASRKWNLEVVWLDIDHPPLQSFQVSFAKLSDAIAAKREQLIKDGQPLPSEPMSVDEIWRKQQEIIEYLQRTAQQQASPGFANVNQQTFQNAANNQMAHQYGQLYQQNTNISGTAVAPTPMVWEALPTTWGDPSA